MPSLFRGNVASRSEQSQPPASRDVSCGRGHMACTPTTRCETKELPRAVSRRALRVSGSDFVARRIRKAARGTHLSGACPLPSNAGKLNEPNTTSQIQTKKRKKRNSPRRRSTLPVPWSLAPTRPQPQPPPASQCLSTPETSVMGAASHSPPAANTIRCG